MVYRVLPPLSSPPRPRQPYLRHQAPDSATGLIIQVLTKGNSGGISALSPLPHYRRLLLTVEWVVERVVNRIVSVMYGQKMFGLIGTTPCGFSAHRSLSNQQLFRGDNDEVCIFGFIFSCAYFRRLIARRRNSVHS